MADETVFLMFSKMGQIGANSGEKRRTVLSFIPKALLLSDHSMNDLTIPNKQQKYSLSRRFFSGQVYDETNLFF